MVSEYASVKVVNIVCAYANRVHAGISGGCDYIKASFDVFRRMCDEFYYADALVINVRSRKSLEDRANERYLAMLTRRVTSLLRASFRRVAAGRRSYSTYWCQSRRLQSSRTSDYRYENFYERLLKVYGTSEGRVSVSKFLEVRITM